MEDLSKVTITKYIRETMVMQTKTGLASTLSAFSLQSRVPCVWHCQQMEGH